MLKAIIFSYAMMGTLHLNAQGKMFEKKLEPIIQQLKISKQNKLNHKNTKNCANFSGNWLKISCSVNSQSEVKRIQIKQENCSEIEVDHEKFPTNGMSTNTKIFNEIGSNIITTMTYWNDAQTKLFYLMNFTVDIGMFVFSSEMSLDEDINGKRILKTVSRNVLTQSVPFPNILGINIPEHDLEECLYAQETK